MVNLTTAAIKDKLWTSVCPSEQFGNSTGPEVPFWEGVTSATLSAHQKGWLICGIFAFVNTIFASFLITQHLRNYNKPQFQRYYVRIILMIPVYSIVSFLGYRYYEYSEYFELALSFYEAFVIASFFILILNMLGDGDADRTQNILSRGKRYTALLPLCCFHFYTDSWWFLETLKVSILQYAVIEPISAIVAVILQATGHLCTLSYSFKFGHVYLAIIDFISVTLATYMLIQFYIVVRHDIRQFKPLWKFIAIKLVIFLSFYQSICLSILGYAGVIKATEYWSQTNIEYGLNSLIITIEMFLFCILDWYAYSYKEFISTSGPKRSVSMFRAAVDSLNIFDLFVEVYRNIRWFWYAVATPGRFDIHGTKLDRAELVRQENQEVFEEPQEEQIGLKYAHVRDQERPDLDDREELENNDDFRSRTSSYPTAYMRTGTYDTYSHSHFQASSDKDKN